MTDSAFNSDPVEHLFDSDYNHDPTSTTETAALEDESSAYQQPPLQEPFVYGDADEDKKRSIYMTCFFLVLMVIYIGFCCYYRKTKLRGGRIDIDVFDEDGLDRSSRSRNLTRRQQRENNRAVLDESISASTRAMRNEEEKRKLEERKGNIKKALLLRLIVDEEEEEEKEEDTLTTHGDVRKGKGGVDLYSSYWEWSTPACEKEMVTVREGDEEEGNITDLSASDNGDDDAAQTIATELKNDSDVGEELRSADIEEGAVLSEETEPSPSSPPTAALEPPSSPRATSSRIMLPPTSPSRLSMYADALNCGKCFDHHNVASPHLNNSKNSSPSTISLSVITSNYGEECNICLSQFQVGDRAAWSKHHHTTIMGNDKEEEEAALRDDDVNGNNASSSVRNSNDAVNNNGNDNSSEMMEISGTTTSGHGCTHVFHEECIHRWLLVRDGCPICRRSYFPQNGGIATSSSVSNGELIEDLETGIRNT